MKIIGSNNASGVGELGLKRNIETLLVKHPNLKIETSLEPEFQLDLSDNKLKQLNEVYQYNKNLATLIKSVFSEGYKVLNLIGDHSAAIATISASASQAKQLGVIWIDAHPDINTNETTPSGNIHGMSIAALLNLFDSPLNNIVSDGPKISPERIVYIGLRSIDEGEQEFLDTLNILYFTYEEVMEIGFYEVLKQTMDQLSACDGIHISLDLDSMDPKLVPGVSVPVDLGFSVEEVEDLLQNFIQNLPVIAVDIAEYNPEYDKDNITLEIVYDLIESIGGFYETKS